MLVILIPCKNLDCGKSRLSSHLTQSARRDLCELLLRQTLGLATSVVASRQIFLITQDSRALEIGREFGTSPMVERGEGLNSALCETRMALLNNNIVEPDVVILPIDLPFATTGSLSRVVNAEADVVLVPDEEGTGTNLLCIKANGFRRFQFSYGHDSFRTHRLASHEAGLSFLRFDDNCLAFDIDRPEQYMRWQATILQNHCVMTHDDRFAIAPFGSINPE